MATLPPPATKKFSEDSLEARVYGIIDKFEKHIPIMNDRNRLGFNLYRYMVGEGDPPALSVKYAKLKLVGITAEDLVAMLQKELDALKK